MREKSIKLKACCKIIVSIGIFFLTAYCFIMYKLDDFYSYNETERFIAPGNLVQLIFTVLSLTIICVTLCYTIYNLEKIYALFRDSTKKKVFLTPLYFAASFVFSLSPINSALNDVKGFDRVFGAGFIAGEDVSRRISSFTTWIILFVGSFILLFLFFCHLEHQETQNKERAKAFDFLRDFTIVANCTLVFRAILFFQIETNQLATINDFTTKSVMLIAITCLIYLVFHLDKKIQFFSFLRLQFILFCISFPMLIVSGTNWQQGNMLFGFWLLMTFISVGVLLLIKEKRLSKTNKNSKQFTTTFIFSALIPFVTSAYIELIHILNQWNVFVSKPALIYCIGICCLFFLSLAWDLLWKNRDNDVHKTTRSSYLKWVFAIFVFGMACLSTQMPLSSWYDFDLFEGANNGILIGDLLNFGKIPIVEHYGGHQMSGVWSGLLYGILNQDYTSAYVAPYINLATAIMAVIFYFLIREIWNERMAMLVTLLIPYNQMWYYFGMGAIVCLTAVAYVRKSSYLKAVLFWLSCIWCIIYRLDLGFAFGVSAVISLMVYIIKTKKWETGKKLLITLIIEGIIAIVLWFVCCIIKQINPITRLKEFLQISFSNQTWAYQGIGNTNDMAFAWFYLFLPFSIALGMVLVIFSKRINRNTNHSIWIIALILGIAFFLNFSRGLVRHSWHEKQTIILAFTGYLFLSLALSILHKNKRIFLPAFVVLLIFNNLLVTGSNMNISLIAESAVSAPETIVQSWTDEVYPSHTDSGKKITYWQYLQENQQKVKRVMIPENKQNLARTYSVLLDLLLEDDETFIDFTNVANLYPLLNREDPVYIVQSPSMLSGEFTQEEFIREIDGVPLVIMPGMNDPTGLSIRLDGINNSYKYYKVVEAIYQKYTPLCRYGEKYVLWCLREKKEEYLSTLSRVISEGLEYKDKLIDNKNITAYRMNISQEIDGTIVFTVTDIDPFITNLETVLDIRILTDLGASIIIDYSTEQAGMMEFLYTTEPGEAIDGQKVISVFASDSGTAEFQFPVTENTILRFDIPDAGIVRIHSMRMKLPIEIIEYGYDGPFKEESPDNNVTWKYNNVFHIYSLNNLPLYWGEYDNKKASKNLVLCDTENQDGVYIFDAQNVDKSNGNYVKFHTFWDGHDTNGQIKDDDESCNLALVMGKEENGTFDEKCRFDFTVKEGEHDYLIRCSADYYWYQNEINAIKIVSFENIENTTIQILEGD